MKKLLLVLSATLSLNAFGAATNMLDLPRNTSKKNPVYIMKCFRGEQTIFFHASQEPFEIYKEHSYLVIEQGEAKIVSRANCYITMNRPAMIKEGFISVNMQDKEE